MACEHSRHTTYSDGVCVDQSKPRDGSNVSKKDSDISENEDSSACWDGEIALFIFKQCIISRLILLFSQFVFNAVLVDYPTDAFKGVPISDAEMSLLDHWVQSVFGGLTRWDATHFLHIAKYGYYFENSLAFFPFYPSLIYVCTYFWHWATPFMHLNTALMITGITINFASFYKFTKVVFLLNGQLLYLLLLTITKSNKVSLLGCLIFTINPSSIFFSAIYSENIFMLFSQSGLLALHLGRLHSARYVVAAVLFSLSFMTRSNGIMNFGYILFHLLQETIYSTEQRKYIWRRDCGTILLKVFRCFANVAICWLIFVSQIASHNSRMYRKFCVDNQTDSNLSDPLFNFVMQHDIVHSGSESQPFWCSSERPFWNPMPVFYKHIQEKYWDVKLFGYWQYKKIPCFMLASPAIFIIFCGCVAECTSLWNNCRSIRRIVDAICKKRNTIMPFMIHTLVLSSLAVVVYNVEVVTRILFSSSPFMYITLAKYMTNHTPLVTLEDIQYPTILPFFANFSRSHFVHFLLLSYFLGYFFIGTLLHVNWLPFT